MSVLARTVLPALLLGSLLTACATHSDGTAPLNQRTWPICSVIGGLVGGGQGAIESGEARAKVSRWPITRRKQGGHKTVAWNCISIA